MPYFRLVFLIAVMTADGLSAAAQTLKEGYVDRGTTSEEFHNTLLKWAADTAVNDDDNFFVSRVKPRERFRNAATQVNDSLDADNDKHLIAWLPCNNEDYNALPDGRFDSEVFSMWSYVTHWGNWSCPLGRVPGAFLDVAHKNGVAVSSVADIPTGTLSDEYAALIDSLPLTDIDADVRFFKYFGVDGLGYNSEFTTTSTRINKLQTFHGNLVKNITDYNPLFENIWYDGTTYYGKVVYDEGLNSNNQRNFGSGTAKRTSLFLNYGWNSESLLSSSEEYAISMDRSPLDLYCGINLQGGDPSGDNGDLLGAYNLSIGLWGAHGVNMFWESRYEKGAADIVKQQTYRQRIERYFTGGTRNPANTPALTSLVDYHADNYDFGGMSTYMTARSALAWELDDEPLVTYFNLGNGLFFNIDGERRSDSEWYNIGMQDYLPTWRWWFATRLLGGDADDVPDAGLDADFTYDDAYFGGSCMYVEGTVADEYLHLLKTQFALAAGDVITVRCKLVSGSATVSLVLSAKGSETDGNEYAVITLDTAADDGQWLCRTITIGDDLAGDTLALVALHFTDADDMRLLVGEFSITRTASDRPETPEIVSASVLYNCMEGTDGKLIFNMPNDKEKGEPCYNSDVNVSYFRLYARREGGEETFIGATTSWAAILFRIPFGDDVNERVSLGVSAVSPDMQTESDIAWSDYMDVTGYMYDDGIQRDRNTIHQDESFTLYYTDPLHEDGTWTLLNHDGDTVYSADGHDVVVDGLDETGNYDLVVGGYVYDDDDSGARVYGDRTYPAYIQITADTTGRAPEILTLMADGSESGITVTAADTVVMTYTGVCADGHGSRGISLDEKRFGVLAEDADVTGGKSFSVTFWIKINGMHDTQTTQLFSVADKQDEWDKTDYGWMWVALNSDGTIAEYTFRGTDAKSNPELQYIFDNTILPVGNWMHIAMTFDYDDNGDFKSLLYVNGEKQPVTRWKRSSDDDYTEGEPDYESYVYSVTSGQVIAVGGDAYLRDGIDGAVDNFEVWDKVLSAEEVMLAMSDINADSIPDGLLAAWDFENDADDDYMFASVTGNADILAGRHYYVKSGSEGQGTLTWLAPEYTVGSPFLAGTAYDVVTSPSWTCEGAALTDAAGDGETGEAALTYTAAGDYSITLTLANLLGEDERTFAYITVEEPTGIDDITDDGLKTYITDGTAYIRLASAGSYDATVYSSDGCRVADRHVDVTSQSTVRLRMPSAGTYILCVKKDGRSMRRIKFVSR